MLILKTKRETNYELLRILACFMVIVLHTSAYSIFSYQAQEFNWKVLNFYDSLVRSAVPIFLMMSGAFVLKKERDLKTFFKKYILKYIVIYFVWSLIYAIDALTIKEAFKDPSLLLSRIFVSKYHLWFIITIIGIYFLYPIIYQLVHGKEEYLKYYLIIFFEFCIFKNTCLDLFGDSNLINKVFAIFDIPFLEYIGYFVLGYYLYNKKYDKIKKRYLIAIFLGAVLISSTTTYFYRLKSTDDFVFYSYFTLPIFLESISLFTLFTNIKVKNKILTCVANKIAPCTLGIYLIHLFVLEHLQNDFEITASWFNPILAVPVVSIMIFLISFIIVYIIKRIPYIKELV